MNNEERYEISKAFLDKVKPLKDIYVKYNVYASKFDSIPALAERTGRKVVVYQNSETNKVEFTNPYMDTEDANYVVKTGSSIDTVEIRYIEKAQTFALCSYRTTVNGKEDKHTSKTCFNGAYLVFPDKTTKLYISSYAPSYFCSYYINCVHEWTKLYSLNNTKKAWHETFQKVFPFVLLGGNSYNVVNNFYVFENWMRYKEPSKRSGKMQETIDKLLKIPLSNIDKSSLEFTEQKYLWDYSGENVNVYVSPVKDDIICIRWFKLNDYSKEFFETSRLYVDKKKQYFCRKNSFGQFIAQTGKMQANNFFAKKVIFEEKDFIEGTRLEYYKNILSEIPEKEVSNVLWAFIYHPLTEIFWKQGLKKCVISFTHSWSDSNNFERFLIKNYGNIDMSKKSVNKILGINNYQISLLNKLESDEKFNTQEILKKTKTALGVDDISSFTNEQSKSIMEFCIDDYYSNPTVAVFSLLRRTYSLKMAFSMIEKVKSLKGKNIDAVYYYPWSHEPTIRRLSAINVYHDYLSMVNQLNEGANLRPHFEKIEDIQDMHDTLLEIFNLKKTEIDNERFAKRISIWKKFEYEGKEFSVIIPTKATDLAKEGFELHHCVKGYIPRVTNGDTNIVFIRKKEELDKPFFTVEITNDNTIQQVHGFGNRNANTEEGMTEFVKEWAKKRKLNISNFNKIR